MTFRPIRPATVLPGLVELLHRRPEMTEPVVAWSPHPFPLARPLVESVLWGA